MTPKPPTAHCPRCEGRLEIRTVTRTGELWGQSITFQETERFCPRCAPSTEPPKKPD